MNLNLATVREHDRDPCLSRLDLDFNAALAHRDHPLELEAHLIRIAQLPGNMTLSLVERVVDQRRGHDQTPLGLAPGGEGMKAAGRFLGAEARRQPPLA